MVDIVVGSLEERIIRILMSKYPITVDDLREELGVSDEILERMLKSLEIRGILMRDTLPDKEYVRLVTMNIRFIGRKTTQKTKVKKSKRKKETKHTSHKKIDYDSMYA